MGGGERGEAGRLLTPTHLYWLGNGVHVEEGNSKITF